MGGAAGEQKKHKVRTEVNSCSRIQEYQGLPGYADKFNITQ